MAALEKSIDAPGWVAQLSAPNTAREPGSARAKQLMDTELLAMGDDITKHPEIGFQEQRSIGILIAYLKKHNFEVTTDSGGLETAFVGRSKEITADPILASSSSTTRSAAPRAPSTATSTARRAPSAWPRRSPWPSTSSARTLPGSVTVFGTPGEEMMPPDAKVEMFKAGVFNGMDIIVRSHSLSATTRPAPGFGTCCLNIDGVKYTFSGAPAHQMTPWAGRNALEAVIHLFNNIDAVRISMRPEARVQGIIRKAAPRPTWSRTATVADFYIRYPDAVYLTQVREFVDNAARAAALATGTKVKIDNYGQNRDGISVASLAEVGFEYMKHFGATNVQGGARQAAGIRGDRHGIERDSRPGIRRADLHRRQPHL